MENALRIGEVASKSGVSVDTVRYYEQRRLLPAAPRSSAGYRIFTDESIERVLFIKQAQELGFSLDEIRTLLTKEGINDCQRVHDLLNVKLTELNAKLRSIRDFRRKLSHYLAECEDELRRYGNTAECPVVVEIADTERS